MVCLGITKPLVEVISRHFADRTLPEMYKELITVVLQKEQKKDYSLLSSYCPITLENTLAKLIEKIVANYMAAIAKEYRLLLQTQIGAQKHRSTLLALELLILCVQTTQEAQPRCVVSILSLDISSAFNNVSYNYLIQVL